MRLGIFAIAAGLSTACGLIGDAPLIPALPPDGVGDFGDSSPVEVCLGTARISPDAAGGACVAKDRVAVSCLADAECGGLERCVCGRCIVPLCEGATGCEEGLVCRDKHCTSACTQDIECPQGRCVGGGCATPCESDSVCAFGERCDALDGVCRVKACSDTVKCGAGETCETERIFGEVREPEVVFIQGAEIAYAEILIYGPGATPAIYRARVDAPGRWVAEPTSPVLSSHDGNPVGAPSVLVSNESVQLFYRIGDGLGVGRATSHDGGRTFQDEATSVLAPAEPWEKGWVGSPSVAAFHGRTWLFYEGGPRAGIGVTALDGAADSLGTRHRVVSTATLEDATWWHDISEVGAPYAVVDSPENARDALRLYFTARGVEGTDATGDHGTIPADANDSIGLVATTDLGSWSRAPRGPVLAETANLRNYLGEREAAIRLGPSGARAVYVATDTAGQSVRGLARTAP